MANRELVTKSAEATRALGKRVSASLKGGEIFALVGELGSGKTTFVQGFALGLGVERVISPTFILMKKYDAQKFDFYHLDLYRLEGDIDKQVRDLGVKDILGKKDSVAIVEWADKAKGIYPTNTVWIKFENLGGDERKISYEV